MNLKRKILKILKEETNNKFLTSLELVLNKLLINEHKDIVCRVKISQIKETGELKLRFYFISGYGHAYKPVDRNLDNKREQIMDDAWRIIYNLTSIPVYLESISVKNCD